MQNPDRKISRKQASLESGVDGRIILRLTFLRKPGCQVADSIPLRPDRAIWRAFVNTMLQLWVKKQHNS
jgi:hypothetical protein